MVCLTGCLVCHLNNKHGLKNESAQIVVNLAIVLFSVVKLGILET